jgi:hypothetical protein
LPVSGLAAGPTAAGLACPVAAGNGEARKTVVVESAPDQPTAFAKASASNAPVRAQASATATSGAVRKAVEL